ncbi:DUF7847 domain-containing protein [Haloferax volcanii]|uniref:DUF7847 domain-containing protein n=1 Tax=Haloferax volcanii (strain ATCC 29605 / DSM 3757 / JCM 8879 / NBRC 14742 / NCIMB 2012 / VKM B-1768 / DS2) TaxID=309800 RepID=D4GQZ7_HALVD|nr:hypothetical protein [Haloferax volcanii]ADE02149.2 uncharacterized protein HVO_A0320 [Haloferax volcanii DS2]MDW7538553.1 hypothetical protein [Haloferax volcanii]
MGVLQALRRTPGALKRAPGLLVPQLIVFALLVPQLLLQSSYPLVSTLYSLGISAVFLLVTPFIQGGMFGMADEALTTRSSLSRFVADGKANYLSLLIAYVLLLVVNGVIGAVGVAAGFGAFLTHGSIGTAFIGLAAIAGLLYLVVAFFVQFYGQAIVIDGASAIDSFKRSYRVVRGNLLATVGYMLLALVIGALSGGVYAGVSLLASADAASAAGLPTLSTPLLVVVGLLAAVIGSVVSAFLLTFSVAVYDELTG